MVVTKAAVPMTAEVAVVGNSCNNGDNGSGVDGGGDDGGCGDGECNGGSGSNGNSNGSGKATKTTAATPMAVGRNATIN
jgi:hypothetical protein